MEVDVTLQVESGCTVKALSIPTGTGIAGMEFEQTSSLVSPSCTGLGRTFHGSFMIRKATFVRVHQMRLIGSCCSRNWSTLNKGNKKQSPPVGPQVTSYHLAQIGAESLGNYSLHIFVSQLSLFDCCFQNLDNTLSLAIGGRFIGC